MRVLQRLKKYGGYVFIGGTVVLWFYAMHADNLMDQRAKYTIGYLTGYHYMPKSGKHFDFRFTTAGSVYEGSSLSDKGMATANGSRFVVKYDSLHPGTNVGYFAQAIPDSIR